MTKKAIILLIMVILWMGVIFYMSNSSGDDSGGTSEKIIMFIVNKYDKLTGASIETINYHQSKEFKDQVNYVFRKICHFSEFFILGVLVNNFFISINYSLIKSSIFSSIISIIYAISDEIHQTFVSGRSGQVMDVLIDSSGVIVGVILVYIIYTLIEKKHKKV